MKEAFIRGRCPPFFKKYDWKMEQMCIALERLSPHFFGSKEICTVFTLVEYINEIHLLAAASNKINIF